MSDVHTELAALRKRIRQLEVYSDAFHHLPHGLSVWHLDDLDDLGSFRFVACNPAHSRSVGAALEPCVGTTMRESFPDILETELPTTYREVIRTGVSAELPEVRYGDDEIPGGLFAVTAFHLGGRCVGVITADIRDLEQRLAASELLYQRLFDNAVDMVHLVDDEFRIVDANLAEQRKLGYSREELIGMPLSKILCGDDLPVLRRCMARVRGGDAAGSVEASLIAKDGSQIPVVASPVPIMIAGQFRGAQTIMHDITDRKRIEDELRRGEERFRLVLKAPIVLFTQDRDLRFTWVYNPDPRFDPDHLIGKTDTDIAPEEVAAAPMALKRRVLETGEPAQEQIRVTLGDVTTWHDLYVEPHRDATGELIGVTCVSINITERMRAEERFRTLFEHASDALYLVAPDGRFVDVNRLACEALGYTSAELLERGVFDVDAVMTQEMLSQIFEALAPFETTTIESVAVRKDGSTFPIEVRIGRLEIEGETRMLSVLRDITERQQRAALKTRLVDEERRRIARELHDGTSQSFTSLLLGLRALAERADADGVREDVLKLEHMADQAARDIDRMARGLHPSAVDDLGLPAALQRHVEDFTEASRVPVDLHIRWREGPAGASAELGHAVYRIVQEALANVAKHSDAESVSVVIGRANGVIRVVIEDDGRGFDESAVRAGAGMGLLGIRERAMLCGGTVEVDAEPGRGTVIAATFPLPGRAS